MNLKRLLGLDTQAERYAYAVDPVAGYISAQKMSGPLGHDDLRLLLGRLRHADRRQGRASRQRARQPRPSGQPRQALPEGPLRAPHVRTPTNRAQYPLLRTDGKLERVGWDEALDDDGREVPRRAGSATAPSAVGVISTGQLVTEEFYTLGKLVQLGFGTRNYDGNTTLCMASAVSGYKRSFGSDGPPGAYEDLETRRRRSC